MPWWQIRNEKKYKYDAKNDYNIATETSDKDTELESSEYSDSSSSSDDESDSDASDSETTDSDNSDNSNSTTPSQFLYKSSGESEASSSEYDSTSSEIGSSSECMKYTSTHSEGSNENSPRVEKKIAQWLGSRKNFFLKLSCDHIFLFFEAS